MSLAVPDMLFQITSWCDDETLDKLCLPEIWSQISSFARLSSWWTARIGNLLQIPVSHQTEPKSWKDVYHSLLFALVPTNKTGMVNKDPYVRICWAPVLGLETTAIEILLAVRDPTNYGYQVLVGACTRGWTDIARLILSDTRTDLEYAISEGFWLLDMACQHNHVDVVRLLLANPRSSDERRTIRSNCLGWYSRREVKTESMQLILDHHRSLPC